MGVLGTGVSFTIYAIPSHPVRQDTPRTRGFALRLGPGAGSLITLGEMTQAKRPGMGSASLG